MEDIILSVAPSGPWGKKGKSQPVTPEEVIEEAIGCTQEGASVVHLHPWETAGRPRRDMSSLEKTFHGIYDLTDLIIEAGTENRPDFSLEDRILPATLEGAVFATLNMSSFHPGEHLYAESVEQVRLYLDRIDQYRVKPSLEIYDTGQLMFALRLIDEGLLEAPFNFTFVFNVLWGMTFSRELLSYLIGQLPSEANWGVVINGTRDFYHHLTAAELGADFLRVGFEYSPLLGGPEIFTSAQLVGSLRRQLEQKGRKAMSPYEAGHKLLLNS